MLPSCQALPGPGRRLPSRGSRSLASAVRAWLCLSVLTRPSLSTVSGLSWVHDSQEACACGCIFPQSVSPHQLPAPLPRRSLLCPSLWGSAPAALLLWLSVLYGSGPGCALGIYGIYSHCCESEVQPPELRLGAQGWPSLSQPLQQSSQLLPRAALPLVQLSSCLLLLAASWDSTSNTTYAIDAAPGSALTGALSLSL